MKRLIPIALALMLAVGLVAVTGPSADAHHRPWHNKGATTTTVGTTTTTTTTPPTGLTRQPIDGGTGYYGRFSNPLPDSPSFFPIGVWGAYAFEPANVALDKSRGLNTYVWAADPSPGYLDVIRNAGMYAILDKGAASTYAGPESVARLTEDEWDMRCGPTESCYGQLESLIRSLPQDGRALYANYGKGVALPWWATDSQAQRWINGTPSFGRYQDFVSADLYWHTDPYEEDRGSPGYGDTVERVRHLDGLDGKRQPVWNFVEVTCPWNQCDSLDDIPTPAEIRGAVWHSIIAGARGIIYFQHAFAGPCTTHHALRDTSGCYTANQQMVTTLDAQIAELAPVLNADFAVDYVTPSSNVSAMAKIGGDGIYVFAAANWPGGGAQQGTLTVDTPTSGTATVLFENRTVSIVNGVITDTFADGNAAHIYKWTSDGT